MHKFIEGQKLVEVCGLADFELFAIAAMVSPLMRTGNRIRKPYINNSPSTWDHIASGAGTIEEREEYIDYLKESYFRIDKLPDEYQIKIHSERKPPTTSERRTPSFGIEQLRRAMMASRENMLPKKGESPSKTMGQDIKPFPCHTDTTWEQITFILKADDMVYLETPIGSGRFHFSQLGFSDRRKGDAPNQTTWPFFQALARMNGEIALKGNEYDRQLTDKASWLNKHLQNLFGIKTSIWSGHYKRTQSYRARFSIRDERDA